jgi:hypothetical protein
VPLRKVLAWFGLLVAAAVVVVAGIYVVFWPVSDLIARHDVGAITGPHRAAALQAARDAARGRLLTFGAGLFAAGALIYTARNFTLTRRAVELTEQGQVTDRYTKAIEQLGSKELDVRIGGIYALERVARDSPRDHPTVMEVLITFVREHSREPWPPSVDDEPGPDVPRRRTRPDIQAAVTVIGRRNPRYDPQNIIVRQLGLQMEVQYGPDLTRATLTHANLTGANLAYARLSGADLSGADLFGADLSHAFLARTDLTGADLTHALLTRADFGGAILTGAFLAISDLTDADLTRADLTDADLTDARLTDSDLTDANLTGTTTLTGATFTGADLDRALWPPDVTVPEGWQRDADSGRLKRVDTNADGAATD